MDRAGITQLVEQLAVGFDALQTEYQTLFGQQQAVERKLATAREQYNELAKLYGAGDLRTPPLSLSSSPGPNKKESAAPLAVPDILELRPDFSAVEAARKVRGALDAAQKLRNIYPRSSEITGDGVKIWSGPSADKPDVSSSLMPSISESPLEQDFTIEGKPSKLGCPFASMANKKLSSHAASVLSRYNPRDSYGAPSAPTSSVSRVNGKESLSRRASRRASFTDPVAADRCGLSDHNDTGPAPENLEGENAATQQTADVGVCPIRFLDQHSPEEVATYFEKHKHEIPRSHEVCVRRYQSNEEQIRQLDEKYGSLVSMIQGLGAKHKEMLPDDPEDDLEGTKAGEDKSIDKVQKWANSVSKETPDEKDHADSNDAVDAEEDDSRQSHFDRALRDIRVGESPSRPWGIQVPLTYLEKHPGSQTSSRPAQVASKPGPIQQHDPPPEAPADLATGAARPAGRCPFSFDRKAVDAAPGPVQQQSSADAPKAPPGPPSTFDARASTHTTAKSMAQGESERDGKRRPPRMVFTGPVFIGYDADDAAKILRASRPDGREAT